jgi:hypothetical protein
MFKTEGHVATSELTSIRRRDLKLRDARQRRSLPQQGGEVQCRGTCGNVRAHLSKEAMSEAEGRVAAPDLTSVRRRCPKLRDVWQRRILAQ